MTVEDLISTMDLWSFIAAIVSLVLAIVAIVISVLFYVLGRDESKIVQERAKDIASQTEVLKSLFDTMMKTSFEMIKENSTVMHNYMMATVGKTNETSKNSQESDSGIEEHTKEDQSA
jgi:hypothetical protein